jgi:hypothetical protein
MPAASRRVGRTPYGHSSAACIAGPMAMKATTRPELTLTSATAVSP